LIKVVHLAQKLDAEVVALKATKKAERHVLIDLILVELGTLFGIN